MNQYLLTIKWLHRKIEQMYILEPNVVLVYAEDLIKEEKQKRDIKMMHCVVTSVELRIVQ